MRSHRRGEVGPDVWDTRDNQGRFRLPGSHEHPLPDGTSARPLAHPPARSRRPHVPRRERQQRSFPDSPGSGPLPDLAREHQRRGGANRPPGECHRPIWNLDDSAYPVRLWCPLETAACCAGPAVPAQLCRVWRPPALTRSPVRSSRALTSRRCAVTSSPARTSAPHLVRRSISSSCPRARRVSGGPRPAPALRPGTTAAHEAAA